MEITTHPLKMASTTQRRKSRSPRKDYGMSMRNMYQDRYLQMYLLIAVLASVWFAYYSRKNNNWWPALQPKTPSWGNNEALLIVILFAWYLGVAITCVLHLMCYRENYDARMVTTVLFLVATVQLMVFAYLVSDGVNKYDEVFTNFVIAGAVTLFIAFKAYTSCYDKYRMIALPTVLALGTILYLIFWSYHVKKH